LERKENEKSFTEAEIDRLLYVAATRSKSALIIPKIEKEKLFLYPLNKNINSEIKAEVKLRKDVNTETTSSKEEELKKTKELRSKLIILDNSYFKLCPSKFTANRDISKISIAITPTVNSNKKIEWLGNQDRNPRGKVYGTIIHRAIEILINKSHNLTNINNE